MGKAQKTMMVPEDLYKLIEYQEQRTGATFTRQAVAALLRYFLSEPTGPDSIWMRMAIALERGNLRVMDVGLEVAKERVLSATAHARVMKEHVDAGSANPLAMDECYARMHEARAAMNEWEAALKRADDPLKALFAYWAERAPSPVVFVTPHPDGTEERITGEEVRRAEWGAAEEGDTEPPPDRKKKK